MLCEIVLIPLLRSSSPTIASLSADQSYGIIGIEKATATSGCVSAIFPAISSTDSVPSRNLYATRSGLLTGLYADTVSFVWMFPISTANSPGGVNQTEMLTSGKRFDSSSHMDALSGKNCIPSILGGGSSFLPEQ